MISRPTDTENFCKSNIIVNPPEECVAISFVGKSKSMIETLLANTSKLRSLMHLYISIHRYKEKEKERKRMKAKEREREKDR